MTDAVHDDPNAGTRRVLVVDDDELVRETVKDMLEMEGFAVSIAENGLEALESIDVRGPPCFVLLDLMMPVMDGVTFLETLLQRGDPPSGKIPIVLFSALSEASGLATRYGCEVLPKPVTMDGLITAATRLCG